MRPNALNHALRADLVPFYPRPSGSAPPTGVRDRTLVGGERPSVVSGGIAGAARPPCSSPWRLSKNGHPKSGPAGIGRLVFGVRRKRPAAAGCFSQPHEGQAANRRMARSLSRFRGRSICHRLPPVAPLGSKQLLKPSSGRESETPPHQKRRKRLPWVATVATVAPREVPTSGARGTSGASRPSRAPWTIDTGAEI